MRLGTVVGRLVSKRLIVFVWGRWEGGARGEGGRGEVGGVMRCSVEPLLRTKSNLHRFLPMT
jgi:hypothetical protein